MYQKVLVPLDGSELAECALDHVKKLAKEGFLEEIVLLSVFVPLFLLNTIYDDAGVFDIVTLTNDARDRSKKYLGDLQSKLGAECITVKTEFIESARPASIITEYAHQNGVDLIVMATHGYTGVKKMLLGSVAYQVVHESHVPVLLIRPEEAWK